MEINKNNIVINKKLFILFIVIIIIAISIGIFFFITRRDKANIKEITADNINLLESYEIDDVSEYDKKYYILGEASSNSETAEILKQTGLSKNNKNNFEKYNYVYIKIINDGNYSMIEPSNYVAEENTKSVNVEFLTQKSETPGNFYVYIYEIPILKDMHAQNLNIKFESNSKDIIRYSLSEESVEDINEEKVFNYLGIVETKEDYDALLETYKLNRKDLQDIKIDNYNYLFFSISNSSCTALYKFKNYQESLNYLLINIENEIRCDDCKNNQTTVDVYALPLDKNVTYDINDITIDVQKTNPNSCSEISYYIISFDSNGGNKIEDKLVQSHVKYLDELPTPVRSGYKFLGWYYNNKKFSLSEEISSDIKLEAKWQKIENKTDVNEEPIQQPDNNQDVVEEKCITFLDVPEYVSIYTYQLQNGGKSDCIKQPDSDLINSDLMKFIIEKYQDDVITNYRKLHGNDYMNIYVNYRMQGVKHENITIGYLITYEVSSENLEPITYTLSCENLSKCQLKKS